MKKETLVEKGQKTKTKTNEINLLLLLDFWLRHGLESSFFFSLKLYGKVLH